jgi:hypothetical protein
VITDALLAFVPTNAPLSLVGGAGVVIVSNVFDILGNGVGQAPTNAFPVTQTVFGADMGVGGIRPELNVLIGTACAGAAGQLLKAALQGAADPGAAGNYTPASWTDIVSVDNMTMANLAANTVLLRTPFLPTLPANLLPRFYRLAFSPMTATALPSGNLTAGTISSALVTMVRDDQANRYIGRNYKVA